MERSPRFQIDRNSPGEVANKRFDPFPHPVSLEDGYGSYTTLSVVMGISGSYHSGNSRHAQTLAGR